MSTTLSSTTTPIFRLLLWAAPVEKEWLDLLPSDEQVSVLRYLRASDKSLSLASALLKHLAITRACGVSWKHSFVKRDNGHKPYYDARRNLLDGAVDSPGVEFNVSHHGEATVLVGACCDGPLRTRRRKVGIDVTRVEMVKDGKAVLETGWRKWALTYADVFSAQEMKEIIGQETDELEERLRRFYTHWALNEAYLKMTGDGLGAEWVRKLEFRGVKTPRKGMDGSEWGEAVRDVSIWRDSKRLEDVTIELVALGDEYIVATAIEGTQNEEALPDFEEIDVRRDIIPLATDVSKPTSATVGVLALQGAFHEHLQLLRKASSFNTKTRWTFIEVRTPEELSFCDALIIPGGESTTMSLVAARSGLLEPLREFVKVQRKPTWGTCAGLILLAEAANRTKQGGQDLIGGLDVRVSRNHFGRQVESFQAAMDLPFLEDEAHEFGVEHTTFEGIFIRAPIVEKVLETVEGEQLEEKNIAETVVAPSKQPMNDAGSNAVGNPVEIMATLSGRKTRFNGAPDGKPVSSNVAEDIVSVRQGNVFGTSFHPELTQDARIHVWWLRQVQVALERRRHESL